MMTTMLLQQEILNLKKENDICILAHTYQSHNILEVADFTGDSFALSKFAANVPNKTILMCGVRFMAETVKILSPDKRVILSHPDALCPMANQLTAQDVRNLRKEFKDCAVVAYINTTAELKCECDVCVTSSSALDIVKKLPQKDILFIPDCNLGSWIEKQLPQKNFHFIKGGCPVHMQITSEDVENAKRNHPDALLLVHPECLKEVTDKADFAGSTSELINFIEKSTKSRFIIGTDNSVVEHMQFKYPDKKFIPLSKKCICSDMRLTTLADVYNCVRNTGGEEIILDDYVIQKAYQSISAMLN